MMLNSFTVLYQYFYYTNFIQIHGFTNAIVEEGTLPFDSCTTSSVKGRQTNFVSRQGIVSAQSQYDAVPTDAVLLVVLVAIYQLHQLLLINSVHSANFIASMLIIINLVSLYASFYYFYNLQLVYKDFTVMLSAFINSQRVNFSLTIFAFI